jgi:hypothetical protein
MARKWMSGLGLLLCIGHACANESPIWITKDSLHPEMVPFIFKFYAKMTQDNQQAIDKVEIINEATSSPIQVLGEITAYDPQHYFHTIDTNFDGVKDIRIAKGQKNGNVYHYYWSFDRMKGQFIRNTALEEIPNAEFDTLNKQITSVAKDGHGQSKSFYQVKDNKLVLVKQEKQTCDENNHCENLVFVLQTTEPALEKSEPKPVVAAAAAIEKPAPKKPMTAELNSQYLFGLANRKAACLAPVKEILQTGQPAQRLKAQKELSECYKGIILDLAQKYYPNSHFGQDLETEINQLVEHHHQLLYKMAHCPQSKKGDCHSFEELDVLAGTVDYLNELIEFMVLNIGEGYAQFNPEAWLKQWDGVFAKA